MGQIHNRVRSKSTEPLKKTEISLIQTEHQFLESAEVDTHPTTLILRCHAHGQEGVCLCLTAGCQEDPVICANLECGDKIHPHDVPNLMDIKEFYKVYSARENTYNALKTHYLKKLNSNYELFSKCYPELLEEIHLDSKDLKALYDYCDHYEDANWKILNGKVKDVPRDELLAFVQKPPIKLFEDRFALFRHKLLRRESAFNSNTIKTVFSRLREELIRKKKRDEELKKKDNSTPVIKENKMETVCERLQGLTSQPKYLIIATNDVQEVLMSEQQRGTLSRKHRTSVNCFKNPNMDVLEELTIYTNWYIQYIPEYELLAKTWMAHKNLQSVTILTRHEIKDAEPFEKMKTKIDIFSEEWDFESI